VDGFFGVVTLKRIPDYDRVVFLLASGEVVRREYFNREDKRDMYECIMGLMNPEAALENVFRILYGAEESEREIRESRFKWFKRERTGTDPMDTIRRIEGHFGCGK